MSIREEDEMNISGDENSDSCDHLKKDNRFETDRLTLGDKPNAKNLCSTDNVVDEEAQSLSNDKIASLLNIRWREYSVDVEVADLLEFDAKETNLTVDDYKELTTTKISRTVQLNDQSDVFDTKKCNLNPKKSLHQIKKSKTYENGITSIKPQPTKKHTERIHRLSTNQPKGLTKFNFSKSSTNFANRSFEKDLLKPYMVKVISSNQTKGEKNPGLIEPLSPIARNFMNRFTMNPTPKYHKSSINFKKEDLSKAIDRNTTSGQLPSKNNGDKNQCQVSAKNRLNFFDI